MEQHKSSFRTADVRAEMLFPFQSETRDKCGFSDWICSVFTVNISVEDREQKYRIDSNEMCQVLHTAWSAAGVFCCFFVFFKYKPIKLGMGICWNGSKISSQNKKKIRRLVKSQMHIQNRWLKEIVKSKKKYIFSLLCLHFCYTKCAFMF